MLQRVKKGVTQLFDLSGGITEEDGFLQFTTVPLNGWVPSFLIATILTIFGVFVIMREPSNWYVSLVLWVFGGILLSRTKHSMQARLTASQLVVVYTFDKREGTLTIKTTTVAGVSSEDHWLDEIYDVKFFVSKDMQGGSTADAYLCFTKGKKIKLFSGHLIGIRLDLKYNITEKLHSFMFYVPTHDQGASSDRVRRSSRSSMDGVPDLFTRGSPVKKNISEEFPIDTDTTNRERTKSGSSSRGNRARGISRKSSDLQGSSTTTSSTLPSDEAKMISDLKAVLDTETEASQNTDTPADTLTNLESEDSDIFI